MDESVTLSQSTQSPLSHVTFIDIPEIYPSDDVPLQVRFKIGPTLHPQPTDTIRLYQIGWMSTRDYLCMTEIPSLVAAPNGSHVEGCVTMNVKDVSLKDGEFYQFCYVVGSQHVRGASPPFQFVSDDYEVINGDGTMLEKEIYASECDRDSFVHAHADQCSMLESTDALCEVTKLASCDSSSEKYSVLQLDYERIVKENQGYKTELAQLKEDNATALDKLLHDNKLLTEKLNAQKQASDAELLQLTSQLQQTKEVHATAMAELTQNSELLLNGKLNAQKQEHDAELAKLTSQLQQTREEHARAMAELVESNELQLNEKLNAQQQEHKLELDRLTTEMQHIKEEHKAAMATCFTDLESLNERLTIQLQRNGELSLEAETLKKKLDAEMSKILELETAQLALHDVHKSLSERYTQLKKHNMKLVADITQLTRENAELTALTDQLLTAGHSPLLTCDQESQHTSVINESADNVKEIMTITDMDQGFAGSDTSVIFEKATLVGAESNQVTDHYDMTLSSGSVAAEDWTTFGETIALLVEQPMPPYTWFPNPYAGYVPKYGRNHQLLW